ncbi:MAG: transposase, partial [Myxococcales bacterium]|nr:transposase [Myxococcales bacterium]
MNAAPPLAELISLGLPALVRERGHQLNAHSLRALRDIARCRSGALGVNALDCPDCHHHIQSPRSCANRSCPTCQHHLCARWLERQRAMQLPVPYFMLTFTLPSALRPLAYRHPRAVYAVLFAAANETLQTFAANDPKLAGTLGATAVLHTHNRRLDYHPHLHLIVPGLALDAARRQWRKLRARYLFNSRKLASVFRARLLDKLARLDLALPDSLPRRWIVHCVHVGNGDPALTYLARYLYRGVCAERDILAFDPQRDRLTLRYRDGKTRQARLRHFSLVDFLFQLAVHVLPKGFHRVRQFGLLHPNARQRRLLLQLL